MNYFLLPNEKLCVNVAIIKFELFMKKNMSLYFDFIDAIEKSKFRLTSGECSSDSKHIYLSLFSDEYTSALKEFFSQPISHIHL